jgi:hypothetical protein
MVGPGFGLVGLGPGIGFVGPGPGSGFAGPGSGRGRLSASDGCAFTRRIIMRLQGNPYRSLLVCGLVCLVCIPISHLEAEHASCSLRPEPPAAVLSKRFVWMRGGDRRRGGSLTGGFFRGGSPRGGSSRRGSSNGGISGVGGVSTGGLLGCGGDLTGACGDCGSRIGRLPNLKSRYDFAHTLGLHGQQHRLADHVRRRRRTRQGIAVPILPPRIAKGCPLLHSDDCPR